MTHIDGLAADMERPLSNDELDEMQEMEDAERLEGAELDNQVGEKPELEEKAAEEPARESAGNKPEDRPMVDLGAMHEERRLRREAEDTIKELRGQTQRMEETFQKVLSKTQEEAVPQFDDDPGLYLEHNLDTISKRIEGVENLVRGNQEERHQLNEQEQFVNRYRAEVTSFAQSRPDFMEAYNFLLSNADADLTIQGYTPQERSQVLQDYEVGLVQRAGRDGVNPGERIVAAAEGRGYKQQAAESAPAAKIETIKRGQEASSSLGGTAGAPSPAKEGTLEHLTTLQGGDFDREWEKLRRAGRLG